jgi:hypothetical protein
MKDFEKNQLFDHFCHIRGLEALEIHQGILIWFVSLREYSHECS